MTRAFCLAHRYAKMEVGQEKRPAENELALKAVHFSKRMRSLGKDGNAFGLSGSGVRLGVGSSRWITLRWETPLNLLLVATAFALHVFWLFQLNWHQPNQRHTIQEMGTF